MSEFWCRWISKENILDSGSTPGLAAQFVSRQRKRRQTHQWHFALVSSGGSFHLMRASFFGGEKSAEANFIRKDLLVSPFTPAGRIKRRLFVPFVCERERKSESQWASQPRQRKAADARSALAAGRHSRVFIHIRHSFLRWKVSLILCAAIILRAQQAAGYWQTRELFIIPPPPPLSIGTGRKK